MRHDIPLVPDSILTIVYVYVVISDVAAFFVRSFAGGDLPT